MEINAPDIFDITDESAFNEIAIKLFSFQYQHNTIYNQYVNLLKINVSDIRHYRDIPCLPIDFFKNHKIMSGNFVPELEFHSSKTTGFQSSVHYVKDADLYKASLAKGFRQFLGDASEYSFFALLPSYLERKNASLVHMVKVLMEENPKQAGGFYLHNHDELVRNICKAQKQGKKIILWGVSFALLDLAETHSGEIRNIRIIETGGMKGRRKEITRESLHNSLTNAFSPISIDSEYGMTELLSQAWSINAGPFKTPPWMKILIRDMHDPFTYIDNGKSGLINVIDLSNIYSCAFIETQDVGKLNTAGFEVLGRLDNSEIRGCNLMVQ
ncbi:MAG: acyl transferase [Bacteroidota bacterium]|nr:acyl transferase [Bacteroidota bacterium]